MPSPRELQQAFCAHLRGARPASLNAHFVDATVPAGDMLGIHRNNFRLTLQEALASIFPAVEALVGEACFAALAGEFVERQPPVSPLLSAYGAAFPDFLDDHPAVIDVPYLGDVARLEWAWNTAFHAADAPTLEPEDLQRALGRNDGDIKLALHPAVRLISSSYPLLRMWRMARWPDEVPDDIDLGTGPDHLLVLRPRFDVAVWNVDAGTYAMLDALRAGRAFAEAVQVGHERFPETPLEASLGRLLAWGAFNSLATETEGAKP
jgi:hypothetical protein